MTPFLKEGDTLIIDTEKNSLFNIGEIIAFQDSMSGELVCHRVISDSPLKTKGDRSLFFEYPDESSIVGTVDGVRRNGELYTWGKQKKLSFRLLSYFSFMNSSNVFKLQRYASLIAMFIISKLFFLTKESHKEALETKNF